MTFASTTVELSCGHATPDRELQSLSETLKRNLVKTAGDFLDMHLLPRGVVLVLNGETMEPKHASWCARGDEADARCACGVMEEVTA